MSTLDDDARPAVEDPTEVAQWRAAELSIEGRSLPYIAEKLGISKTSAHRYVKAGHDLMRQIDYLDRRRGRETGAMVMAMVRSWMADVVDSGAEPKDVIEAAKVVIKAEERVAKLLGLDAPAEFRIGPTAQGAAPPPFVVDAVNTYRDQRARGEIET